ncbi:MAG TPA: DUF4173 domain-containing protein [Candidatus Limnocylindrales bacterium]|nr:DUF4173 domain-containing protein [Candidatus Limnocylindrales bacterium]
MDVRRFLLVLVAAVAGAVVIPLDRAGIGWAIAGLAALALLRNWFGVVAAALLGMGAVRSAGWVFVLCAVAAVMVLAATVVNGRTWRELGLALPRWVWGGWQGIRSVAVTSDRHGAVRVARGIGMGIILVIVFGLLLGSAEQRFADLLTPLLSWPRLVTFAGVALLGLGALHHRRTRAVTPPPAVVSGPRREGRREWGRFEWAIPVALVDLLFATFAIVQFTVLFGGHDHVLDPDGPTYAQYARGGFLELATVAVLTLAVVAAVLSRVAPADGSLARVLVGLLCGLTLVIVGSALWRMRLYVQAFGFTRSRLLATAFIVWLGLILLLLLAVWRRAVLPRLTLAAGALVLLGLAILNPDRIVAQTVIGRWQHDGHLDAPYLASLSLDALPALDTLPEPKRWCIAGAIIRSQRSHMTSGDAWNEWNASREAAGKIRPEGDNCEYYLTRGYRMEGNWTDPSELR